MGRDAELAGDGPFAGRDGGGAGAGGDVVGDSGAGELGADLVFEAGGGLVITLAAADDEAEFDAEAEVGRLDALGFLAPVVVGASSVVVRLGFLVAVVDTAVTAGLGGHKGDVRHGGQLPVGKGLLSGIGM